MKINNKTQLNMVIGYPLEHSQSPMLHTLSYQLLDINAVLLAQSRLLPLKSLIQAIKILSITLIAVTSPYKEKIIKYLDQCSDEVSELQAANTIIQRDGKLYGYNTDVAGISYALRHTVIKNKKVLILGAGGAARALAYFLKKNQAQLFWINRTSKKATVLAKKFGGYVVTNHELNEIPLDIIINTTPIGSYPNVDSSPLPNYAFHAQQVVFDMVYNPLMTPLLKQAKKYRAKIISGLEMFIGQGLNQIELLSSKRLKTAMQKKLRKLLIYSQQLDFCQVPRPCNNYGIPNNHEDCELSGNTNKNLSAKSIQINKRLLDELLTT
jgi:shikimate dehydrogenase